MDVFTEGLVGVKLKDKWGYIDSTGKLMYAEKNAEPRKNKPTKKKSSAQMKADPKRKAR